MNLDDDTIVENDDDDALDGDGEWLQGLRSRGLPIVVRRVAPTRPVGLSAPAAALVLESWAPATRTAYEASWARFAAWCTATRQLDPFDAEPADIADYVAYHVQAGLAPAYLARNIAAITAIFEMGDRPSPARHPIVRRAIAGAKRVCGSAPRRAAPLHLDDLRHIVNGMGIVTGRPPTDPLLRRDRTLLLVGWAAALRSAELVGLDIADLTFSGDPDSGTGGGVVIRVRHAKTDPDSAEQWVAVPYSSRIGTCPVRAAMILARHHRTGPLFRRVNRHGRVLGRLGAPSVTDIVRRHVTAVGADPALYSSHSLRAGWVTEARRQGVPPHLIMRHTRHTDQRMLDVYDRPADLLEQPALDPSWW